MHTSPKPWGVRGATKQTEELMIRKITMTSVAAGAVALGLSAAAHAAPASGPIGAGVKTAVLDGSSQASTQQVHWRRPYWRRHHHHHHRRFYFRRWW